MLVSEYIIIENLIKDIRFVNSNTDIVDSVKITTEEKQKIIGYQSTIAMFTNALTALETAKNKTPDTTGVTQDLIDALATAKNLPKNTYGEVIRKTSDINDAVLAIEGYEPPVTIIPITINGTEIVGNTITIDYDGISDFNVTGTPSDTVVNIVLNPSGTTKMSISRLAVLNSLKDDISTAGTNVTTSFDYTASETDLQNIPTGIYDGFTVEKLVHTNELTMEIDQTKIIMDKDIAFTGTNLDISEIVLEGKNLKIKSPKDAVRAGIAFVTEDRKSQGLLLPMDCIANTTLPDIMNFSKCGNLMLSTI